MVFLIVPGVITGFILLRCIFGIWINAELFKVAMAEGGISWWYINGFQPGAFTFYPSLWWIWTPKQALKHYRKE